MLLVFRVDPSLDKALPKLKTIAARLENWMITKECKTLMSNHPGYTFTDESPAAIGEYIAKMALLQISTSAAEVRLKLLYVPWYKKLWYRNTVAEHSYGTISLNKAFFDRDDAEIFGTLFHEWLHSIGFHHEKGGVTDANLRSVPYVGGSFAEAFYRGTYAVS